MGGIIRGKKITRGRLYIPSGIESIFDGQLALNIYYPSYGCENYVMISSEKVDGFSDPEIINMSYGKTSYLTLPKKFYSHLGEIGEVDIIDMEDSIELWKPGIMDSRHKEFLDLLVFYDALS